MFYLAKLLILYEKSKTRRYSAGFVLRMAEGGGTFAGAYSILKMATLTGSMVNVWPAAVVLHLARRALLP